MESILSLLAGAAAKATALLALAALVNLSWRTASASTRHFVWTIGVTAALVLPVAAIAIARLGAPRLAIPLEMPVATVTASIAQPGEPAVASPSFSEAAAMGAPVSGGTEESVAITPEVVTRSAADVAGPRVQPVTAEIELPALAAIVASSLTGDMFTNWRRSVVILWLLGALVAVLPLVVAIARVRLLARSARPVSDPRWKYFIEATPAISHLASRVRVLESSDATMPMTWGVARPALLVPAGASAWPEWKCRNILLHELAHVERRDCLTQLVAHLACAVYWFNPLVWVAAHRMRVERELACDDCVISAGAPASDYASNLLEVARSLRAPSFTSQTAIAMARPSQLSGRLLAVLDAHRNRSGVSRPILAATAISASALVVVLASLTTRAAVATAAEAPSLRVPAVTMDGIIAEAPATTAAFLPVPLSIVQAMQAPAVNVATARSSSFFSPVSRPLPMTPVPGAALTASCWEDGDNASVSINNNSTRSGSESWHVRYSREGCSLEMRAEGKFRLRADLSDLESISSDGWFRVEEREGRNSKRIEIRSGGSGLEHQYWVNGDRVPYNDDARRWLASTLLAVERRTAFAAKDRVPQLYRAGGTRAVLAEIAQMPSAYAKSRYYGEMLDMEGVLDANALNDIVGRVAVDLRSSDYYLSQVLGRLSTQRSANESTWRAFATAAGGMKSDYYKSQLLKKVLNSGRLSDETVAVLLKSASGVESDYYLSDLLKSVASKYAVNDGTASIYASALGRIESDYYRMELLKAMQSSESWDGRTAAFVLTSVRGMKSDYYKSQSLISLVTKNRVDNWNAFFDAVGTVGSSHYKRQALNAALQREPLTKPIVAGVLNTAARIDSDHEKSQILATVARSYKLDGDLRAAYEKVADAIDSEHYRGSALVALRRNESR